MNAPSLYARKATFHLENCADDETIKQLKLFFKKEESVRFYGVKTPKVREIVSELVAQVRHEWSLDLAVEFCEIELRDAYLESKILGLIFLSKFRKKYKTSLFQKVEYWLSNKYIDNWAVTDALATEVIYPLIKKFPPLIAELQRWTNSSNIWLRRGCSRFHGSAGPQRPISRRLFRSGQTAFRRFGGIGSEGNGLAFA